MNLMNTKKKIKFKINVNIEGFEELTELKDDNKSFAQKKPNICIFDDKDIQLWFKEIVFGEDEEKLSITFEFNNATGEELQLFLKNVTLNKDCYLGIRKLEVFNDVSDVSYCIPQVEKCSFQDIKKVIFSVEIDDVFFRRLYESLRVEVTINTNTREYECRLITDAPIYFDDNKNIDIYDSTNSLMRDSCYKHFKNDVRRHLRLSRLGTIWEICRCSEDEIRSFIRITEEDVTTISNWLNENNLSFRPKNIDKLLYGYPKDITEIVDNKVSGWEAHLYLRVLLFYYNMLLEQRKRTVNLWKYEDIYFSERIESLNQLQKFLTEKITKLVEYIDEIKKYNIPFHAGEDGNGKAVSDIVDKAIALISVYKRIYSLKNQLHTVASILTYHNVIEELYVVIDNTIKCVDTLFETYIGLMKVIEESLARTNEYDIENIDYDIAFNFDMTNYKKAMNDLVIARYKLDDFEEICILNEDDEVDLEFKGIRFIPDQGKVYAIIEVYNDLGEKSKIWIKKLGVNHIYVGNSFDLLGSVDSGESKEFFIDISSHRYFNYKKLKNISFIIEIDDMDNDELYTSKRLDIVIDTNEEKFSLISLEESSEEDGNDSDW